MALKPKDLEKSPFLKPTSRKKSKREMKAALRLAYGKVDRGLNKEIRASRVAQKRTGDYFDTYGGQVDAAADRTADAYSAAQASIGQASSGAAQYAEQLRQRMASEAQADAARRGVPYDPSGSYTAADASLARINAANTLSGVTGAQGAAQGAYYDQKAMIGQRESLEQRLREKSRRTSLKAEKRDLAGDKAAQIAQMLAQKRDSERDFYLGLKAAQEPGKARRHASSESQKSRRASRKEGQRGRAFDRKQANKDRNAEPPPSAGGNGGANGGGGEREVDRADVRKIVGILRSDPPPKDVSKQKIIDKLLQQDETFEAKEIRRAIKRLRKKDKGGKKPQHIGGPQ